MYCLHTEYKFQYVITDLSIGSIVKGKLNQAQLKYKKFSPMSELYPFIAESPQELLFPGVVSHHIHRKANDLFLVPTLLVFTNV